MLEYTVLKHSLECLGTQSTVLRSLYLDFH